MNDDNRSRPRPRTVDCLVEYVTIEFARTTRNACCIPASVLLHELMKLNGYTSVVKTGLIVVHYDCAAAASFHVWIETSTGRELDVGHDVLSRQIPEMAGFRTSRLTQRETALPPGCIRIDMGTREAVKALVEYSRMINAYLDGKPFWSKCPALIQEIRDRAMVAMAPRAPGD